MASSFVSHLRLQSRTGRRTKRKAKEWFAKRKFRTRNKSDKEKDLKFTKKDSSLESVVKVHVKEGLSRRLFIILEVGELHGGAFERWTSLEAQRKDGISDN